MTEVPAWVTALQIPTEDYLEWLQTFPSSEFILSWAIESKRVDEAAYLKWATTHYNLPVVKPDFFQKPPPLETWKKFLEGPWSPTVLPLYEWKDTLFVGVLEPKNFALDNVKVQLVLAPSTVQNQWWHKFSELRKAPVVTPSEAIEPELHATPPPLPIEVTSPGNLALPAENSVVANVTVLEALAPSSPLGLEEAPIPTEAPPPEEIREISSTSPVADSSQVIYAPIEDFLKPEKQIDLTVDGPPKKKKIKVNASRPNTDVNFDNLQAPEIPHANSPEGIYFDEGELEPPPPRPEAVIGDCRPDGLSVDEEFIANRPAMEGIVPSGLSVSEVPAVELGKLENLLDGDDEIELPDIDIEKQQSLIDDLDSQVRGGTLAPTHQGSTPIFDTGTEAPKAEEPSLSGIPEGVIQEVFEKFHPDFDKVMVLLRDDGRLSPFQWDQTWVKDGREKGDVELSLPSIFKIVVESRHPFHGYARPSPPNDKFFRKWNQSKYPEHVTALPLKANDEVFGVLIAIADVGKGVQVVLADYERIADRLATELSKTQKTAA